MPSPRLPRLNANCGPGPPSPPTTSAPSPPGTPRHFSALSPADKALEALVNIHALARAPVCIRTSSYLSAISALVAPAMRTVTVNRTIGRAAPFPEAELLACEQAAAR